MSEWAQGVWFGIMLAYSPSLFVLALLLWRHWEGHHEQ